MYFRLGSMLPYVLCVMVFSLVNIPILYWTARGFEYVGFHIIDLYYTSMKFDYCVWIVDNLNNFHAYRLFVGNSKFVSGKGNDSLIEYIKIKWNISLSKPNCELYIFQVSAQF